MPSQRSQLEATFLNRLQPKATAPDIVLAEQGELAGRRRDPSLFALAIHRIRPDADQVRRFQKSEADPSIQELSASIRAVGILQPIDVRYLREADYYEIVAGERRFIAAKLAGLAELPVQLLDATEADVHKLQILENIHRQELSPLELGAALLDLSDNGATPEDLATLLCKTKSYITKALSIARHLSPAAKQLVQDTPDRFQSMAHLYEVSLLSPETQLPLLQRIGHERLTRDDLQQITATIKRQADRPAARGGRPPKEPTFTTTIRLDEATVSIRLRHADASKEELAGILRQALDTLI